MERLSSGVPGLDDLIEGGYIKDRYHLVTGEAGTGKSTFAMHFAMQAIKDGGKATYISMEEPPEDMDSNLSRYGLNVMDAVDEGNLQYIYTRPYEVQKMVDESVNELADQINEFQPDRLVVDSVTTFNLKFARGQGDEDHVREGITQLMDVIDRLETDVTTLFTSEAQGWKARFNVEFIMDSVVKLYNVKQGESRVRALEIYKMRGTNHSKKIHSITMEPDRGMVVHEQSVLLEQSDTMI